MLTIEQHNKKDRLRFTKKIISPGANVLNS